MSRTTDLKSLAHPDWPYAGTAHEWRGFVKKGEDKPVATSSPMLTSGGTMYHDRGFAGLPFNGDRTKPMASAGVYQKQNFGPNLD